MLVWGTADVKCIKAGASGFLSAMNIGQYHIVNFGREENNK
jgi:hypothetical protein